MLLGLGIDILSLSRLQALIARRGADRLAARICSPRELGEYRSLPSSSNPSSPETPQLRFLAARWTTKEAAYKALPSPVRWKDLDLSYAPNGRPLLALRDPSPSLLVSISHDAGVVVAAVVACD